MITEYACHYQLKLPSLELANGLLQFMVKKFIPEFHNCLKQADFEQKEKDRAIGENFLVVLQVRYLIFNNSTLSNNVYSLMIQLAAELAMH